MGVSQLVEQLGALIQYVLYAVICSSPRWTSAPAKEASEERRSIEIPALVPHNEKEYQDEQEEDEDEMELETLELLPFQPAIRLIDLEALRGYALEVRIKQVQIDEGLSQASDQLTCSIDDKPLHGGFNIVYLIHFSDGHRWVARIPINAPNFGPLDKEKIDSEYHTMRHLRNTLQLPIPEIYTWETNSNAIGTPFALMSFITGVSVMDRWLDPEWITEDRKLNILTNLAYSMAILQGPTYDRTGTLRFGPDGAFSHIGPEIHVECDEERYGTEGTVSVTDKQVCDSLDQWMLVDWDPLPALPEKLHWPIGLLQAVRLALASVPDYLRRTDRFVLEMVDLNYQNIFIDDDCNITGIIDWDGVRVVPQGMGATRYPSWITRDWEPGNYGEPDDGDWAASGEDSPENLSKYRKHYAGIFEGLNLGHGYNSAETRLSHILEAIKLAARSRLERQYTTIKLLHHAFRGKVPFTPRECFEAMIDINSDEGKAMERAVSDAFSSMWFAEWECDDTKARNDLKFEQMMPY